MPRIKGIFHSINILRKRASKKPRRGPAFTGFVNKDIQASVTRPPKPQFYTKSVDFMRVFFEFKEQ